MGMPEAFGVGEAGIDEELGRTAASEDEDGGVVGNEDLNIAGGDECAKVVGGVAGVNLGIGDHLQAGGAAECFAFGWLGRWRRGRDWLLAASGRRRAQREIRTGMVYGPDGTSIWFWGWGWICRAV